MNSVRSHLRSVRGLVFLLGVAGAAVPMNAQHPVLAPIADTAIVVSGGVLHYSAISVPAGVTVRFAAPVTPTHVPSSPAVVYCDGDVVVDGTLSVDGTVGYFPPFTSASGWVSNGEGAVGQECGTFPQAGYVYLPPTGGLHATHYGSVVPFSLEGGSWGGRLLLFSPGCSFPLGGCEFGFGQESGSRPESRSYNVSDN